MLAGNCAPIAYTFGTCFWQGDFVVFTLPATSLPFLTMRGLWGWNPYTDMPVQSRYKTASKTAADTVFLQLTFSLKERKLLSRTCYEGQRVYRPAAGCSCHSVGYQRGLCFPSRYAEFVYIVN